MSNSCKICGNSHNNKTYTLKEMMFGTGHLFEYLECNACGTIQQLAPPSFDLSAYYPEDYYAYIKLNESSPFRIILKKNPLEAL